MSIWKQTEIKKDIRKLTKCNLQIQYKPWQLVSSDESLQCPYPSQCNCRGIQISLS